MRSNAVLCGMLAPTETVQINDPVTVPPLPSLAVIRVVNGLDAAAAFDMVPEISPAEEISSPSGRPVAVKARASLSGSEKALDAENDI